MGTYSTHSPFVFDRAPRNVYWETTLACSLACEHCRARAMPSRDPNELTTEEGFQLIDAVKRLGSLLVLTGGDPFERSDLLELVAYARGLHVPVAVTPSTTDSVSREKLTRLKELGIAALGVSVDGPRAEVHDRFRGVPGTFEHSLRALGLAREVGLNVQVNTTVTASTQPHLEAMFRLLSNDHCPPVRRWSLFVLVPTGRGRSLIGLGARDLEQLFAWVYAISRDAPFHVSVVEAPHYRRYWLERQIQEGRSTAELVKQGAHMGFGVRDGNGVVFVARDGEVFPAGFLPYPRLGNVRSTPLDELYRTAPALQALRAPDGFTGKCGRCRYRTVCGGSRARAWASSGDALGDDPTCAHEPPAEREPAWPALTPLP